MVENAYFKGLAQQLVRCFMSAQHKDRESQLTNTEKVAIAAAAGVPLKLAFGEDGRKVQLTTADKVSFRKHNGQWTVGVKADTFLKVAYEDQQKAA